MLAIGQTRGCPLTSHAAGGKPGVPSWRRAYDAASAKTAAAVAVPDDGIAGAAAFISDVGAQHSRRIMRLQTTWLSLRWACLLVFLLSSKTLPDRRVPA